VLVAVLAISFLVVTSTTVALTTSSVGVQETGAYGNTTAARMAAESGIQASLVAMEAAASYGVLPCSQTTPVPVEPAESEASYTTLITYDQGSSTLACDTAQPSSASIVATGVDGSATVVMEEKVQLSDKPSILPAFDYAIFSPSEVSLSSDATVSSSSTTPADVYAGGQLQCTNSNSIAGNVITYGGGSPYSASDPLSLSSSCAVGGTLEVDGSVELSNTVKTGNLDAIGGSISMNSSAQVDGNAYATGGSITLYDSSTIKGDAYASGAVSAPSGAITGTVCANASSCVSDSPTMPPEQSFPVLDPTSWPAGYGIDTVPSSACKGFGEYQYPNGNVAASAFADDVASATAATTVIDASGCSTGVDLEGAPENSNGTCPTSGMSTYTLHTNIILLASSVQDYQCNTFLSGSGGPYSLAIVVPDTGDASSQGTISLTNTTDFEPSVNVLLYTPATIDFSCYDNFDGQIIAGSVSATNTFTMTASDAAAEIVPGSTGPSGQIVTETSEVLVSQTS